MTANYENLLKLPVTKQSLIKNPNESLIKINKSIVILYVLEFGEIIMNDTNGVHRSQQTNKLLALLINCLLANIIILGKKIIFSFMV